MKFVVPFTIPSTRCTFETTSASRSTFTTGIAAHTAASKRSCTPASDAAANSSVPRDELLVRRDDRPLRREQLLHVPGGRVEAAHQLGDERDRVVVANLGEVGGEDLARRAVPFLRGVANQRAHDANSVPGRALDVVGAVLEQPVDGGTDGAVAEERDRDVDCGHAAIVDVKPR